MALRSEVLAQLDILKRICIRGRTLFLDKEDNLGIDMFEHMETELGRLKYMMEKTYDSSRVY